MKLNIDVSRLLLVLIVIITAAGIVLAALTFRSNPVDDVLLKNRVMNILYILEENKKPLSAYALMYYPATRRAAVFDIPGNLGLLISKINRVDRIDIVYDPNNTGLYEAEVAKLLGIDIDFTIIIKKENLAPIVDLLEGVEIFIPSGVSYRASTAENADERPSFNDTRFILFPSGMTLLDGDKASLYASYTVPDEELEMETHRRQRFFIGFLGRQIIMNEKLKNKSVQNLYHSFFRTSLKSSAFMRLYDELSNIDIDRVSVQTITGNFREVSGQTLIIPHWDGNLAKEIVRQTLGTLTRKTESSNARSYTVEILNGTAVSGLAGRTAEMLNSFGYDIISTGNADRSDYERTIVIHRLADDTAAKAFAEIIRCKDIRHEDMLDPGEEEMNFFSLDYKADFTLIIGRNFNGRYVTGD